VVLGLDSYSIPARLAPALLIVLPTGLAVGVVFPQNLLHWAIGGGVTVSGLLFLLMAERARRLGRAVQDRLYAALGAKPTTVLLRHRDSTIEQPTKLRYHRCLEEIVPDCVMPTSEQEEADPVAADAQYESCTKFLLEATRDRKRHRLVFCELVSYGFVRNLRGMRGAAMGFAGLGLGISATRALWNGLGSIDNAAAVVAVLSAFLFVIWWLRLTDEWVREAAFDYARALLASCERLRPVATRE
jgi:hypothetical protein